MNPEFERLEHVATEYFGGFSSLGKKMEKKSTSFYFYKNSRFGNKFLTDLEEIGINPEYIRKGQPPMFLNTLNLDQKAKEKYLKLGMKDILTVKEKETKYNTSTEYTEIPFEKVQELMNYIASIPVYQEVAYANTGTVIPDINQFKVGESIEKTKFRVGDPKNLGAVIISGNSMRQLGITEGSRVIFNKALEPKSGNIVVLILNGHLMVKQLIIKDGEYEFHSADDGVTPPLVGSNDDHCEIIGVVTESYFEFL